MAAAGWEDDLGLSTVVINNTYSASVVYNYIRTWDVLGVDLKYDEVSAASLEYGRKFSTVALVKTYSSFVVSNTESVPMSVDTTKDEYVPTRATV